MKLIAITNNSSESGGGIPAVMLPLYEHLTERGMEVVLATAQPPNRTLSTRVVTYRTLGPKEFGFSHELLNILGAENPDLVHLHGLWTYCSFAVRMWRGRTGKPVVVSPHGMLDPWALRKSALKKRIAGAAYEWENLRKASCIHALTEGEVETLKDLGFRDHIVKIPNGVVLAKNRAPQESSRKKLLYLGRLHPKKGIAETLLAWSLFQQERATDASRWLLVIAGYDDGGHLQDLHEIVRKCKLEEHVRFTGPVFGAQKDFIYASADALILASHSEGLPMSVLEAWASGRPVFITQACNLPEGFRVGAAFRITTDPENIAATLMKILPDTTRLISAGQAGRALIKTSFNWAKICESWLSLYSSISRSNADPQ